MGIPPNGAFRFRQNCKTRSSRANRSNHTDLFDYQVGNIFQVGAGALGGDWLIPFQHFQKTVNCHPARFQGSGRQPGRSQSNDSFRIRFDKRIDDFRKRSSRRVSMPAPLLVPHSVPCEKFLIRKFKSPFNMQYREFVIFYLRASNILCGGIIRSE